MNATDNLSVTHIGRPIDPRWATNRAIVVASLAAMLGGFVLALGVHDLSPARSLLQGMVVGVSVFLAWALAREVDPDGEIAAFAGAAIAFPTVLVLGSPRLASLFAVLLALRIVNRTVGPAARAHDTIAILLLNGWLAWTAEWVGALAVCLAFLLDAVLRPPHRTHLAAAGASLALLGVAVSRAQGPPGIGATDWIPFSALLLLLPFIRVMRASEHPRSVTDLGGVPLSGTRVRAAQALGLLVVVLAVAVFGREGLTALSPLWAAMTGSGLFALVARPVGKETVSD